MTSLETVQEELCDVETEIAAIRKRLRFAHNLGDANSAGGTSSTFSNNPEWDEKLTRLKSQRLYYLGLIDFINGTGPLPAKPDGCYLSLG